ncbi:carbohydrate ABC transporter permease [Cellulosimicrobium cellulans]|uniref:carbohydrate ABC transporter permease n=1 Tax=Cellulosimicrobium cellulans TaxID=1710 RepID=UPI00130E6584|nr:sugar ABC transporter permease [Cellulosimicrobium cellulans]
MPDPRPHALTDAPTGPPCAARTPEERATRAAELAAAAPRRRRRSPAYLYIAPWFVSFALFALVPMVMSLVMSLTDWPVIGSPTWRGLGNFTELARDAQFWRSLWVTVRFGVVSVPLGMAAALSVAMVLNSNIRGLSLYRTIYYLPAVVSGVAVGLIWRWVLDPAAGLVNGALAAVGVQGPGWLTDPAWVLPSYTMVALWGAGGGMLTYLVALNEVPRDLGEAATLQGAGWWARLWFVTLPLMRPILFYNLVMGIIGAFKKFNDAYVLGGAGGEGNFLMLHIYRTAFEHFRMGYASAMSWVFLVIVLAVTGLVFRFSDFWTFSRGNEER